jgi:hypothetical protein
MPACQECQQEFTVTPQDDKFRKRVSPQTRDKTYPFPAPTLCADCRQMRRLVWRNERHLYPRDCDLCGEKSLSIYHEKHPFPVYCLPCWWSDKWDGTKYGRDFDFSQPFFKQFKKLQDTVPRMMVQQQQNENSEYTANVSHLKNCYLLFSSDFNRDCYYGVWVGNSEDSLDNFIINKCRLTHEAIFSDNIYNCSFVIHSSQCSDSAFLLDCKSCSNCFMCYGLRNKKFCIANKQYSEEDYNKELSKLPISSYKNYEHFKNHYEQMIKKAPYLYLWRNGRIEDSSGDFLTDVKSCHNCYEITEGRDCKNVQSGYQVIDAHDCSYVHGELGYENCECFPMPMKSAFNLNTYNGHDVYYNDMCMNNNSNIWGCVSLKKSKHCLLNKQYTPEEYEELLPRVINHMKETGEYGEFFPAKLSPFDYHETNAEDFVPLHKNSHQKPSLEPTYDLPDDINDTPESVTNEVLACKKCHKNYRIIQQEYKLLKKLGLPLPRLCFECRNAAKSRFRKPRTLHNRKCAGCKQAIQTNYSPDHPEQVFCEECYLKRVY